MTDRIETPLQAWVRLDPLSPEVEEQAGGPGLMLRLGMIDSLDTRYAEVVLSQANLRTLVEQAGGWMPPEGAAMEEGQGVVLTPDNPPPFADQELTFSDGRVLIAGLRGGDLDVTETYHAWMDRQAKTAYRTYSWPVPLRLCPECAAGKHGACSDLAADEDGEPATCQCTDPQDGNPNAQ